MVAEIGRAMRKISQVWLAILATLVSITSVARATSGVCLRLDLEQNDPAIYQYAIEKVEQQFFSAETGQLVKKISNQVSYPPAFWDPFHPGLIDLPSPDNLHTAVLAGMAGTERFNQLSIQDQQKHIRYRLVKNANNIVPHWSPDGQKIAYLWQAEKDFGASGATHLAIVNADGTKKRDVTLWADAPPYNKASITTLNWSADQQYVALQLSTNDTMTVYFVSTADLRLQSFSMKPTVNPLYSRNDPDLSFVDFSLVAWSSRSHQFALADDQGVILGSPEKGISVHIPLSEPEANLTPLWSPDDQFIAVIHNQHLSILSATGSEIQSIDPGELLHYDDPSSAVAHLRWWGNNLLFPKLNSSDQTFDLMAVNPATQIVTTLANGINPLPHLYFSPDERSFIVVSHTAIGAALYLIKENQSIKIADGFDESDNVEWSPDGKFIAAVVAKQSAPYKLTSETLIWMNADGSNQHRISAQRIAFLQWQKSQPDIFYIARESTQDNTKNAINGYLLDVVKGSQIQLFLHTEDAGIPYSLADSHLENTGNIVNWRFLPSATGKHFIVTYSAEQPIFYSGSTLVDQNGTLIKAFKYDLPETAWSPDGSKIVTIETSGNPPVTQVNVLSGEGQVVWYKVVPDKLEFNAAFWVQCL